MRTGVSGSLTWSGTPEWGAWSPIKTFTTTGNPPNTGNGKHTQGKKGGRKKNRDGVFASVNLDGVQEHDGPDAPPDNDDVVTPENDDDTTPEMLVQDNPNNAAGSAQQHDTGSTNDHKHHNHDAGGSDGESDTQEDAASSSNVADDMQARGSSGRHQESHSNLLASTTASRAAMNTASSSRPKIIKANGNNMTSTTKLFKQSATTAKQDNWLDKNLH